MHGGMEYSPSKRRKTSPISSIGVDERTQKRRAASQDCTTTAIRKTFSMSPTKASLARFYPSLLPSTSKSLSLRQAGNNPVDLSGRQKSTEADTHGCGQATPGEIGVISSVDIPGNVSKADGQDSPERSRFEVTTSRKFYEQGKNIKRRQVADGRASPPAGALEGHDEVQPTCRTDHESREHSQVPASGKEGGERSKMTSLGSPLMATPTRTIRRGANTGMVIDQDGEPRLPSTPIHLGLEQPLESPRGLRYNASTEKLKKRSVKSTKSSPLKQQSLRSTESLSTPSTTRHKLDSRLCINYRPSPPLTMQEASENGMGDTIIRLEKQIQALEGDLICQSLVSELEEDDHDTVEEISRQRNEVITKCNQVIRLRQKFLQDEPEDATLDKRPLKKSNMQMSRKQALEKATALEPQAYKPPILSQRLTQFLPPSERCQRPASSIFSSDRMVASRTRNVMIPGIGNCLFTASTLEVNFLEEPPENSSLQFHVVELSSMCSSLGTKLLITFDIALQIITQLKVLELSTWAESEFGNYLRGLQAEANLAKIGTRFLHYSTLCLERLKCWNDLITDFKALSVDNSGFQFMPLPLDGVSPVNMLHLLCRQECSLARGNVRVSFTWRIIIDDEGDIRNDVGVWPEFPGTWVQGAIGAELAKVGKVFELLQKENGVHQAIFTVVKLIFSYETPRTAAAIEKQSPVKSSEA